MGMIARTALAATILAASFSIAIAQGQDHEAHPPVDQATPQQQANPPAGPDASPTQDPSDLSSGMMGGQPSQGMMDGKMSHHQMMDSPMMPPLRTMHQDTMGASITGDPDHDFAALMVPHHQGAIDMAREELKSGKDPELRKLAARMIKDQEKEIKDMNAWLARSAAK